VANESKSRVRWRFCATDTSPSMMNKYLCSNMEAAMTTVTISLPDERLSKLKELAASFGVSSEDLIRVCIDELLTRPEKEFKQTADYVLRKNAELYRRLT
jgi:antitoxin FitA